MAAKCLLVPFMLFILCLSIVGTSHATRLKVCYDEWAPMTIFPSEGSPRRGIIIDMLEQIYIPQGYTLEYYEVPLARGLDMVADGICDMLPEYLSSKHSEDKFIYAAEKTFSYETAFVVRRDDPWRYTGIQSIKGERVATGLGWDHSSMSIDYQNYIDNPNNSNLVEVIAGDGDVINRIFRMIVDDRIDLYADNELVLQYALNEQNFSNELEIVRPGLEKKLISIPIFSKKIPSIKRQKMINIWNEGRVSLRGEKEKLIFEKYQVIF
jgi:polar amino acid transport system substrate-binding protein